MISPIQSFYTSYTTSYALSEADTTRKPDIKICQTDTMVLLSILEPALTDREVNVLIEPKHISVEITRNDIENPVVAGSLFDKVAIAHCRVRIKEDSVLIKLRKAERGRWKSILEEVSNHVKADAPETRIRPRRGLAGNNKEARGAGEAMEPQMTMAPTTAPAPLPISAQIRQEKQQLQQQKQKHHRQQRRKPRSMSDIESDGSDEQDMSVIQPGESKATGIGALETMKKFHRALFYWPEPKESRDADHAVDGRVIDGSGRVRAEP